MTDPGEAPASVLSMEANRRATYFATSAASVRYCAEPPPDIALNRALEAAVSAQKAGISAEASANLSSSAIELAGRSQTVLLARELLYRACEMHLNGVLQASDVKDNFAAVIELIGELGEATVEAASAEKIKAEAGQQEAEAENNRQKSMLLQQFAPNQ